MEASVRTSVIMGFLFAVSQLGALFMASAFLGPEEQIFQNPNDPLIPVIYIALVIGFTFGVLYIIKKHRENLVRIIFLGAVAYTIFFVLFIMLSSVVVGIVATVASAGATAVITYYLVKKPEWYVIDASGILMSIGVTALFGVSLSILPVMILLIVLAAYDAISVYRTKHMIALADGVTQMKLPILLVIPKKRGYSYIQQKPLKQQLDEGDEREAMFMGLGDLIIPGVLVISAFNFLPSDAIGVFTGNLLVALGTLVGAIVGFATLMTFVIKGRPQAGLPLLNGGAILGYVLSYVLVYESLSLGITW